MRESLVEKLQPCLLGRLTDLEPNLKRKGAGDHVIPFLKYQESVLDDLAMLLSSSATALDEEDGTKYRFLPGSVVNYGVVNRRGEHFGPQEIRLLADDLRHAIITYEPRLRAVTVDAIEHEGKSGTEGFSFEVHGLLSANPQPVRLSFRTRIDSATGSFFLLR